jgi:hypothetical protein
MEFSAEDFINGGMGVKSTTSYTVRSSEGYDGFADNLSMEMYRAEQELQSLEAFEMLSGVNASQKIKMVKRIANNYVGGIQNSVASNSIESVCLAQIKSLEDAAAAPAGDAKTEEKPATDGQKKKLGFMKTVFGAIAKFFKSIWNWIVTAIKKFGAWVKNLFAKKAKEKEAPKTDEASDLTNNKGANAAAGSTTSSGTKLEEQIDKAKMIYDFSGQFNPKGVLDFMNKYTALSNSVDNVWKSRDKMLKKGNDQSASHTAHVDNVKFNESFFNDVNRRVDELGTIFGVSTKSQTPTIKSDDFKKKINGFVKELRMASNRDDGIGKLVNTLFGFGAMNHDKFAQLFKNNISKASQAAAVANLQQMCDSMNKFYQNKFVPDMEKPHRRLVTITEDIEKNLNSRLDSYTNVNETTVYMGGIQATLKMACTFEQCVGKVVTNVNSNITYQLNLMK